MRSSSRRRWRSRRRRLAPERPGSGSWRGSRRFRRWRPPAQPRYCASGRDLATTGGRSTCGEPPARSSRLARRSGTGRSPGLLTLPGVGPYTARAVAAIAFGLPVGAVDTNVRRVLGRIVAGDALALRSSELQVVADAAVPRGRSADWTHAVMDIGATVCRPRRPDCDSCPARPWCRFAAHASHERPHGHVRPVYRASPV